MARWCVLFDRVGPAAEGSAVAAHRDVNCLGGRNTFTYHDAEFERRVCRACRVGAIDASNFVSRFSETILRCRLRQGIIKRFRRVAWPCAPC